MNERAFLGLHTFDRWGQNCTTGVFERDGREFVFVPGDTVTLGWDHFAVGLNQDSREELDYLFQEWELEQDPEGLIRESMALVRQAAIGPMLVGRELEELAGGPGAGGTVLGAGQDERSQSDRPPRLAEEVPGLRLERP